MQPQISEPVPVHARRTVSDVMRPAVTTIETYAHLAAAAYLMNHANQSALVVVDSDDRPTAIITKSDLLRAVARGIDTGQAAPAIWTGARSCSGSAVPMSAGTKARASPGWRATIRTGCRC